MLRTLKLLDCQVKLNCLKNTFSEVKYQTEGGRPCFYRLGNCFSTNGKCRILEKSGIENFNQLTFQKTTKEALMTKKLKCTVENYQRQSYKLLIPYSDSIYKYNNCSSCDNSPTKEQYNLNKTNEPSFFSNINSWIKFSFSDTYLAKVRCCIKAKGNSALEGPNRLFKADIKEKNNFYVCHYKKATKSVHFNLLNIYYLSNHSSNLNFGVRPNHFVEFCTGKEKMKEKEVSQSDEKVKENEKVSYKQKFKKAILEYGSVILVFHITISLISLGCCYLIISSGLIQSGFLKDWGIDDGASAAGIGAVFVVAYAFHKALAPWRIAITLSVVPFIVKKLRTLGYLKPPKS